MGKIKSSKISFIFTCLFLFSALFISCTSSLDKGNWQSLFNGENLEGWIVQSSDGNEEFWSVENGVLVANSLGSSSHDYNWLQSKGEYADFELQLSFQVFPEAKGNAGVQFRSRWDPKGENKWNDSMMTGWLNGPQVDLNPSGAWRNGLIYDETRGHQRWISPSLENWHIDSATYAPAKIIQYPAPEWNEMVISCKGTQVQTRVNGVLVSDYDGSGILDDEHCSKYNVGMKGHIAFQIHMNNEVHVRYKNIKIKEL